jgi:3-oxoacyl-[acyl-carrier protein] reductase
MLTRRNIILTSTTAVAPGLITTAMLDSVDLKVLDALRQENNAYTPAAPRFCTTDDITQIVAFIASNSSRLISGSTISASGGK